jgi:endonuclease/exonuclease/phosphatase (EEP) superfamily protein YafD
VNQRSRHERPVTLFLALYPIGLLGFTLFALIREPRSGIEALAQVFAPYFFLPLLALAPFALLRGTVILRSALTSALIAYLAVYPPALNVRPPAAAATLPELRAVTWNIYVNQVPTEELLAVFDAHDPDIVALQETRWRLLADEPALAERFPYSLIRPDEAPPGMALLSRYPILAAGVPDLGTDVFDMPRLMWATIDVNGTPVTVINAHPLAPKLNGATCRFMRCYNQGPRDAQISRMRAFIADRMNDAEPLLVLGDLNVTEREAAYRELAAGLQDAHRTVGMGLGHSWRPGAVRLPVAAIRIDYMFSHGPIAPLALTTDCTWRGSDHCLLVGRFALGAG